VWRGWNKKNYKPRDIEFIAAADHVGKQKKGPGQHRQEIWELREEDGGAAPDANPLGFVPDLSMRGVG
jgi:hypothetical protein